MSDAPNKINTEGTSAPLKNIEIYTLRKDFQNAYAAAFIPKINRITINGDQNKIDALIVHEAWHQRTHESNVHNLPMSLSQHHKLRIHDEISAYLVELMTVRQQYIEAKNDAERTAIVNSTVGKDYSWYFDAVARGEINPTKADALDPVKEEKFIYRGVKDIYSKVLSANHPLSEAYRNDQKNLTNTTFNTTELEDLAQNDKNYKKALQTMYTIGGINFATFVHYDDVDLLVPQNIIDADKQIATGKSRKEIEPTLDINLSEKEQKQFAAQRIANKYSREEIEQLLTTDLSKEDKKLYKKALKQKDKDALKEQENLAKDYLKSTYKSPEKISVYDMSSRFIHLQNEQNYRMALLNMRLEIIQSSLNNKIQESLEKSTSNLQENMDQRQQDFTNMLSANQPTPTPEQTEEKAPIENTPQAYILHRQRERD